MSDFQTINDIIVDGIRNSSYVTVLISSSVFIIYTLIIKLVDYYKTKTKDKSLLEMSKAMKEIGDNIAKLNAVLNKTFEDAEKKELKQCENAILLAFKALCFKISQECITIILHNNISKNKELIYENVNKLVSTEYYKLYSVLAAYEINNVNVASKLKEEWIKEIADAIIQIIYNCEDSEHRIIHLNNKIVILANEYATFVSNKVFNS